MLSENECVKNKQGIVMKNKGIDTKRRSFLKMSGLLGLGAVSTSLLPAEKAEAFLFNRKEYRVVRTRLSMGTYVTMTVIHPSRDEAEQVIGEAFDEVERLDNLLTRFGNTSPVVELNSRGRLDHLPLEIQDIIGRSLYYFQVTGGAFDITVKPLVDLYKASFAQGDQPTEKELRTVLDNVGSEYLCIEGKTLAFGKAEMGITLDGIAKGYIIDRASEYLISKGVVNHLVNGGGDIRASGTAGKSQAWTVAIQDPAQNDAYRQILKVNNGAVATSGNYEVYYDNEKMFHHIVNASTGYSPVESASVTVTAPSVLDADALSTAVFVMGAEKGVSFIHSQKECETLIISRNGDVEKSRGWTV